MNAILTVTVNPCLDVTVDVPRLAPQIKLRCGAPVVHPGGGGVNVSRAIRQLGGESRAFVALGGPSGRQLEALLGAEQIEHIPYLLQGETRTSLTVIEQASGHHYRFVLPGPPQEAACGEQMLAVLSKLIDMECRYVVASGSLLPGLGDDFYFRLSDMVRWHGARFIIDAHDRALRAALPGRPYLIRLNEAEARELAGHAEADLPIGHIAADFIARKYAEVVVVGLGAQGSMVTTSDGQFTIAAPKVKVLSAVGAGDSYVAGLTLALSRGWSLEAANRYGVAAAASAVSRASTELCALESTEALFNRTGKPVYAASPEASILAS